MSENLPDTMLWRLDRIEERLQRVCEKLDLARDQISSLKSDLAVQRVKSGFWGGAGVAVGVVLAYLAQWFRLK